jgi:hypothetical protein
LPAPCPLTAGWRTAGWLPATAVVPPAWQARSPSSTTEREGVLQVLNLGRPRNAANDVAVAVAGVTAAIRPAIDVLIQAAQGPPGGVSRGLQIPQVALGALRPRHSVQRVVADSRVTKTLAASTELAFCKSWADRFGWLRRSPGPRRCTRWRCWRCLRRCCGC